MDSDEEQRRRLADIERDLTRTDPALARRMATLSLTVTASASTWLALAAGVAIFAAGSELFLLGLRYGNWALLVVSLLLLPHALLPYRLLHRRVNRRSGHPKA